MFATLAGDLPSPPLEDGSDDPEADLRARLAVQRDAGLEPLTDGRVPPPEPAMAVERWLAARAHADGRAVKAVLLGPLTTAATVDDPATTARTRRRAVVAAAEAIAEGLGSLGAAGCPMVQVHEPAVVDLAGDPDERRLFVEAHRRLLEAAGTLHVSLAVVGGDAERLGADALFDVPYPSYQFDLIAGPDNWRLIARAPSERGIVCGVVPGAGGPPVGREIVVWAARYAASINGRGLDRVGLATAGDLSGLDWPTATIRLRLLGDAARIAADDSPEHLARELDPRALGIRSAALGRDAPPPPPRRRRRPRR
jgi:methionine synthase II (cobalamin-independent)